VCLLLLLLLLGYDLTLLLLLCRGLRYWLLCWRLI
jgi:hypothetical protein